MILVAALAVAAALLASQLAVWGRVAPGVSVAGIALGGERPQAATELLEQRLTPRLEHLELAVPEAEPLRLTLAELGVQLDAAATARRALAAKRMRLPFGLTLWVPGGSSSITPVLRSDPAALRKGLERVRVLTDRPARDARLQLRDLRVEVVPSREGRSLDASALLHEIELAASAGRPYTGPAPLRTTAPKVATEVARSRAGEAARYLVGPITLRYGGRAVSLRPEQLAELLAVNTGDDAADHPFTFRNARARAALAKLFAWAATPPRDARITVGKDGRRAIVPSEDGEEVDLDLLVADLDEAALKGSLRTVSVEMHPIQARFSTQEATEKGFSLRGSQFTTWFDANNAARATNIARAAKLVDGTVVRPGRVFSLNTTLGPRTANRGFDYAPVIAADNVLRQGIGGGICQYATTLFNTALLAGLPITERHAHSLYISHYPTGRDAAVSWGSADLRFKNDTKRNLVIRSWVEGDSLTVALVGKTGRTVRFTTSEFFAIRKPQHGRANPRVITDRDLGRGIIRWETGGEGKSIKVTRTVSDDSGALLFRDTFRSTYAPLDWIKRIGR